MASRVAISRASRIKTKLETALQATVLEVEDVSHQHAGHASDQNLVKRHGMVYDLLSDELQSGLHALYITAKTPKEAGIDS
ncbi:hypothetical protein SASPL_114356 [Salvia splendens]|uniref:BolA protein n=1 Tax=Salvia splendens TaxID=180675 RepID=A0A8X8Y5X0_SALSN|nr:hypothetical protein SASPL_114356 [Salvia splendens]